LRHADLFADDRLLCHFRQPFRCPSHPAIYRGLSTQMLRAWTHQCRCAQTLGARFIGCRAVPFPTSGRAYTNIICRSCRSGDVSRSRPCNGRGTPTRTQLASSCGWPSTSVTRGTSYRRSGTMSSTWAPVALTRDRIRRKCSRGLVLRHALAPSEAIQEPTLMS
jgi:hypothetical protein